MQECGHESHCFDACCDVSLSVPAADACSLRDCLAHFAAREALDAAHTCGGCRESTRKTKALRLYTPPVTLVLHLSRFSGAAGGGGGCRFARMVKNAAAVDIPDRLDLAPFCNPAGLAASGSTGVYELAAVSEHSGGMGGGHYTATGRSAGDGRWYSFNDETVARAECPARASGAAYVLFYRAV